jgi:hypothetical protein
LRDGIEARLALTVRVDGSHFTVREQELTTHVRDVLFALVYGLDDHESARCPLCSFDRFANFFPRVERRLMRTHATAASDQKIGEPRRTFVVKRGTTQATRKLRKQLPRMRPSTDGIS